MYNWNRWVWPGIIAVVILTALSTWFKAEIVQDDLTAKATSDLSANHSWASVELDGRDLTLKGTAPSAEAASEALQIADDAYDVRIVSDASELLAIADPFRLSAVKQASKITLEGNVPDEESRAALVAAAKQSADEVEDKMTLARGASDGFTDFGSFGLAQLGGLTDGQFDISASNMDIKGIAKDFDTYDAVTAALDGDIPGAGSIQSKDITPPVAKPYEWMADYDGQAVKLSGFAPNADARKAIEDEVKAQLPDASIDNQIKLASGAPAEFKVATDHGIGYFPLLNQGRVSFTDTEFRVSGVSKSGADFETATNRVADLISGYSLGENAIQLNGVSPYIWSAAKDANTLTLDGFVPSTSGRDRILSQTKASFPNFTVVDNMEIAGGATSGFDGGVTRGLEGLALLNTGRANISDDALTVTGDTLSQDSYTSVTDKMAAELQDMTVNSDISAPMADPYRWSVRKSDESITVRGMANNTTDAQAAVTAVANAFSGATVVDRQTFASGQPEGFADARGLLPSLLKNLEAGEANMVGKSISISGRASSEGIAKFVENELKAKAPSGYTTSANVLWPVQEVVAPEPPIADPYRWSVSKLPDGLTVLGNVADDGERLSVVQMVKDTLGGGDVTDKQVIARGKPEGFDQAREAALKQTRYLVAGQANIIGKKVSITGRAKNENIRGLIERGLKRSAPEGYETAVNVIVPDTEKLVGKPVEFKPQEPAVTVEACQVSIVNAINGRKIQFETARATLLPASNEVLSAVLDAAAKCPDLRLEIAGHTDSRGRDNYNMELSTARAQAVVTELISKGMPAERLDAKGYGETSPIADNDTAEGRALNRRIQFKVLN